MGERMGRRDGLITLMLFSVLSIVAGLLYAYLLTYFGVIFVRNRTGTMLSLMLYAPSLVSLYLLFLGFEIYTSTIMNGSSLNSIGKLLRRYTLLYAPIVTGAAGIVSGLFARNPRGFELRAFIISVSYISLLHTFVLLFWFFVVVPFVPFVVHCSSSSAWRCFRKLLGRRKGLVLRWILALIVSGWLVALVRYSLVSMAPSLDTIVFYTRTGDWPVNNAFERNLPRLVDLVVVPIWGVVLAHVYVWLARRTGE